MHNSIWKLTALVYREHLVSTCIFGSCEIRSTLFCLDINKFVTKKRKQDGHDDSLSLT